MCLPNTHTTKKTGTHPGIIGEKYEMYAWKALNEVIRKTKALFIGGLLFAAM